MVRRCRFRRDGDPAPIIDRLTDAALIGVTDGRILAEELTGAHSRWQEEVTARRDAAVWRVLPMLIRQPAVTVRWVQDHARVSQPAAQRAVDQLLGAGVLTPARANRRRTANASRRRPQGPGERGELRLGLPVQPQCDRRVRDQHLGAPRSRATGQTEHVPAQDALGTAVRPRGAQSPRHLLHSRTPTSVQSGNSVGTARPGCPWHRPGAGR